MTDTLVYSTSTAQVQRQREKARKRKEHADRVLAMICAADDARLRQITGHCTACGAVEVRLDNVTGHRDLSDMDLSAHYPVGYGCEVCS